MSDTDATTSVGHATDATTSVRHATDATTSVTPIHRLFWGGSFFTMYRMRMTIDLEQLLAVSAVRRYTPKTQVYLL